MPLVDWRDPRLGDQRAEGLLPVGASPDRRAGGTAGVTSAGASSWTRMAGLSSAANSRAATCLQSLRTGQLQTPTVQLQPPAFRTSFAVVEYGTSAPPRTLPSMQPGGGVEGDPGNAAPHGVGKPGREGAVVDRGSLYCQCRTLVRMGWHVRATFSRWSSDPSYRAFAGPELRRRPHKRRLNFA